MKYSKKQIAKAIIRELKFARDIKQIIKALLIHMGPILGYPPVYEQLIHLDSSLILQISSYLLVVNINQIDYDYHIEFPYQYHQTPHFHHFCNFSDFQNSVYPEQQSFSLGTRWGALMLNQALLV